MAVATKTIIEDQMEPLLSKRRPSRFSETFRLIWLSSKFNETNEDDKHFASIEKFLDPDLCIDFLTDIKTQKILMIISNIFSKQIVPLIHDIPQLNSIFVFSYDTSDDQSWSNGYCKVKGFFTETSSIHNLITRQTYQFEKDITPMSVISSSINNKINELDPSFLYSRLLRETILQRMAFDNKQAKHDLVDFYRSQDDHNDQLIDEFHREYEHHSPIWWYTKESFIYSSLNRALRTQDVEVIIKLGFFIKNLHQQIEEIHCRNPLSTKLTVYRGQGMCIDEFKKLKQNQNGLISFNSFLSTSLDSNVSFLFADSIRLSTDTDLVGILFQIEIDPCLTNAYPFAALDDISYFLEQEKEILFSMHTVFRIVKIEPIEDRLWKINLILTNDQDEQLEQLTDHIRHEISQEKGWLQFGQLMYRMGLLNQALTLYQTLLHSTDTKTSDELSFLHHQLGFIHTELNQDMDIALEHFQKTLEIELAHGKDNHGVASIYNNIAAIYSRMERFNDALEYFQLSLDICHKHISTVDPEWICSIYNNIAMIYFKQNKYEEALKKHQSSINLKLIYFPKNHPSIALSYTNIAELYYQMEDYPLALDYHKKALAIQQRALPNTHKAIAITHHGLAKTLERLNQNSDAIIHAHEALYIDQHSQNSDHYLDFIDYQAELDRLCNKE